MPSDAPMFDAHFDKHAHCPPDCQFGPPVCMCAQKAREGFVEQVEDAFDAPGVAFEIRSAQTNQQQYTFLGNPMFNHLVSALRSPYRQVHVHLDGPNETGSVVFTGEDGEVTRLEVRIIRDDHRYRLIRHWGKNLPRPVYPVDVGLSLPEETIALCRALIANQVPVGLPGWVRFHLLTAGQALDVLSQLGLDQPELATDASLLGRSWGSTLVELAAAVKAARA